MEGGVPRGASGRVLGTRKMPSSGWHLLSPVYFVGFSIQDLFVLGAHVLLFSIAFFFLGPSFFVILHPSSSLPPPPVFFALSFNTYAPSFCLVSLLSEKFGQAMCVKDELATLG